MGERKGRGTERQRDRETADRWRESMIKKGILRRRRREGDEEKKSSSPVKNTLASIPNFSHERCRPFFTQLHRQLTVFRQPPLSLAVPSPYFDTLPPRLPFLPLLLRFLAHDDTQI